jgi:hypothetical protein
MSQPISAQHLFDLRFVVCIGPFISLEPVLGLLIYLGLKGILTFNLLYYWSN